MAKTTLTTECNYKPWNSSAQQLRASSLRTGEESISGYGFLWASFDYHFLPCPLLWPTHPCLLSHASSRVHEARCQCWSITSLFLFSQEFLPGQVTDLAYHKATAMLTVAQGKRLDPGEGLGHGDRERKAFVGSRYLSHINTAFGHFSRCQIWSSGSQNMEVYSMCAQCQ